MRLIVADAYGSGHLESSEHGRRPLGPDEWTEVDVRDVVHAGDVGAVVRYRDDQREVVVDANDTYDIEYVNEDVIDVRTATDAADEIVAAIEGWGTDEARILRALEMAPHDHSRAPWFEQLAFMFQRRTNRELDEALRDELSGDELQRALDLMR